MMPMRYSAISKNTGTAGSGSMMATVMVTAATCNQKQQIQKHVSPVQVDMEKGEFNDIQGIGLDIEVAISSHHFFKTSSKMQL